MKKLLIVLLLLPFFFISYSCRNGENGTTDTDRTPVVSVEGDILYKADLDEALPSGLSGEDSIAAAKSYIEIWINDKLMYNIAKQNIVNKSSIDALVEDYRKSLIVNSYQEQLLKEHYQSVSDSELKNYYELHKDKFKLEENIIKGLYLKIPSSSPELNNFLKWYKQGTDAAIENIEKNTLQNAVNYEYFYDRWVSFDDVTENIPSIIEDKSRFLQTNKSMEVRDSLFVYLLNIKEYKLKGSEAPYEYIKGTLKEVYSEQRKADYLKQVRKDLYDKGVSNEEIKFYDK
ncbi:hypothetical protein M2451_000616 [Dysgonomonas sp. PFB1-18]|uniref:peptidylprolyl isomerase n=1 Tax=unclassified Dysgonomonas TaxID=2630389 RepID=UPI002476E532|nr:MULTISPECIES: peptidyl-prolyl cis-trans isomerase [unclassified Dysgonomonas]MDH6307467.1 hypothetical protein [Dysgonomonas sp. PF1-14]MDH6337385.1 hypothetical protein [Dysgonomonas sp. PF1-16]MDH6379309.1 hypothetical protein [Dysgonomonas sp. PFB1-18]MDH6396053.1 hypothetical protein [Dysgonomonas sp. PF1-23]